MSTNCSTSTNGDHGPDEREENPSLAEESASLSLARGAPFNEMPHLEGEGKHDSGGIELEVDHLDDNRSLGTFLPEGTTETEANVSHSDSSMHNACH